ncbi:hypothetical protein VHEMI09811 [[Torrubiella] hemipterigena]|uniref:alpha-1,2-Mannosidase n=1 Tax=[Torrubiella] hemipterigena TaxID=1531966 RepID=A0A0A1TQS1_9HYPO|nr:hypothetical protein VHEMI09811 [[Torrubiella] hemipterigena]
MIIGSGRVARRYVALLIFALISLGLWRSQASRPVFDSSSKPIEYISSRYNWGELKPFHPPETLVQLPLGTPKTLSIQNSTAINTAESVIRKERIRAVFKESWDVYKKHAWGKDELLPLSLSSTKSLHGWGAQIVDALDGLWIMGFKDDFRAAVRFVSAIDWSNTHDEAVNVFEVTIRYLGGLISAYDLSEEPQLLFKATELADMLYTVFDTPNRYPQRWLDLAKAKVGSQKDEFSMGLAGAGSMCLEFTRLSQITGDPKYYTAVERVKKLFVKLQQGSVLPGLIPQTINLESGTGSEGTFTFGAEADSTFEYFPKMFQLLGASDEVYRNLSMNSLDSGKDYLLFRPMTATNEDILLPGIVNADAKQKSMLYNMEHLACFTGGMYALSGKLFNRQDYLETATRLTNGCIWLYNIFPSGIMPEVSQLVPCPEDSTTCKYNEDKFISGKTAKLPQGISWVSHKEYRLRPEAIESVFYMWRITKDQRWRDEAWKMWESVTKAAKVPGGGYAMVQNVVQADSGHADSMETFWLGETVKYFYLIFEDDAVLNLDDWVFNTEAHAFKLAS